MTNVQQYIHRVAELLTRPVVPQPRVLTSPLDIATSLGYLNTAWRLRHTRKPLFVVEWPERFAALCYDAGTREEVFDRLSALGEVLKGLQIPAGGAQHGDHPVQRLRPYLEHLLIDPLDPQVDEALQDLEHVVHIRNGGQHGNAQDKAAASYIAFGINLPILDWGGAWATIRSHSIAAFDAIRDALLSSLETREEPPGTGESQ